MRQLFRSRRYLIMLALGMAASNGAELARALQPAEVAVIYAGASEQSHELAKHYAKARGIPEKNLVPLTCAIRESMPELDYRTKVVPQLRQELAERKLDLENGTLKCLVTMYDVPLKIEKWQPGPQSDTERIKYENRLAEVGHELDQAVARYEKIALPEAATEPAPATEPATQSATAPSSQPGSQPATATRPARARKEVQLQAVLQKLQAAAMGAAVRTEKLPEPERHAALAQFIKLHQHVAGVQGVLQNFKTEAFAADHEKAAELHGELQHKFDELDAQIKDLQKNGSEPHERQRLIDLQAQARGLLGESHQLDYFVTTMTETESCFDNELALMFADQNYTRGRWIPNPKNVAVYSHLQQFGSKPRTIMVTRIDGSTPEKVREMIDRTIEVEKKGLDGKLYLDARGITSGSYAILDIQMRELNAWLKTNSTQEVVLDDKPELLEAKDCPDAALYCGWYSLMKYHDSCQWLPGAVGYHVASGEMIHLHKPKDKPVDGEWVVNLLDRGFCGTLGPTAEPYLSSFPNPAHFFPLLLCGEFTQGEVWEITDPLLSWRTGYVGDPLYNPYKAHPKVSVDAIKHHPVLRNAFALLRPETSVELVIPPASGIVPTTTPAP